LSASRHPPSDTLAAGQRIGPFVLLAPLGSGGSGRIWAVARVGQLGFSKRMVLKVMRHDKLASESARERFDREACLGGRLSHPNVRAVHDLGSHEGRPFMALSWVDASLEELLEHAPGHALDASIACWIGMQCCSALGAAHEYVDHGGVARPIVHRDVSPGNILLTVDGHALLADLTAPAAEASPPPGGAARFFGSLGYAAPEALRQEACDARADLFSLGAVLFEMLAGAPAFAADDERSLVFQILDGPPLDVARRMPTVPADLAAVVQRCLERRADNRFQSARELRAALARCAGKRSAFTLEQHAASTVREVLGARIREREEALHLAYQRIAPGSFERTDTLPIQGIAGVAPSSRMSLPPLSEPALDLSRSGAAMAISERRPRRRRGTLWAAAVALLLVVGLYAAFAGRRSVDAPTAAATLGGSAPAEPPPPKGDPAPAPASPLPPVVVPSIDVQALRPLEPAKKASEAPPRSAERSAPRTKPASPASPHPASVGPERREPPLHDLSIDRESPYPKKKASPSGAAAAGSSTQN